MGTRSALVAAAVAALALTASRGEASGPPLSVPEPRLRAARACEGDLDQRRQQAVLLVHGTASNAHESWSWNYGRVLRERGYGVCTVDLPGRALIDIQVSAEYVVAAIRAINRRSEQGVDLIGHSQGTLEPRWAIRWWPDVRRAVDDYISLAGPHHGIRGANFACRSGRCRPAGWQMRPRARFLAALNSKDETPGSPAFTSIFSSADELVQPWRTARLRGAANVLIQDLCPGRPVHHGGLLHDAVVFRLVVDTLASPGPARPSRAPVSACAEAVMPGAGNPVLGNLSLYGNAALAYGDGPSATSEPPVAPYAR